MKKVFATLAVCAFALAFVACGAKKEEAPAADTVKVEEVAPAPDTTAVDTTKADTTAAQ